MYYIDIKMKIILQHKFTKIQITIGPKPEIEPKNQKSAFEVSYFDEHCNYRIPIKRI